MKFLEREELANYNFQNEVMKPFVIVMRKSGAVEIRELIISFSQMVVSRVNNVKSGMEEHVHAAYDDHKNIVLLALKILSKIVRDYFPYITETETTTRREGKGTSGKVPSSPYKGKGTFGEVVPSSPYKGKAISGEVVPSSPYKVKGTFGEVVPSSPIKVKSKLSTAPLCVCV
ncbi:UNVERIFIED_CONTAM: Brefeldin A-inhibited guanine nucleotide-exchange protein 2 [Sesamum angustifolium]|uniref:Brefeldin A-inhibited guanine nucleotide-exchange protein 2 n=1 Tax=Sesamum angustifolium TaxID=2727405 RepID=A0AAW2N8V6_9LAMI